MFWFVCFASSSELDYCSFCHDIWLRNWFLKIAFDYNNAYKCVVLFVGMAGDEDKPLGNLDCHCFELGKSGWCRGIVANMSPGDEKGVETYYRIIVPSEKIVSGEHINSDGPIAHVLELLNRSSGFIYSTDSIVPISEDAILSLAYEAKVNRERRERMLQNIHPRARINQEREYWRQLEDCT